MLKLLIWFRDLHLNGHRWLITRRISDNKISPRVSRCRRNTVVLIQSTEGNHAFKSTNQNHDTEVIGVKSDYQPIRSVEFQTTTHINICWPTSLH